MAHRKPYSLSEPGSFLGLLAILGLLWLTGQLLQDSPRGAGMACSLIILGAFAGGAACPVVLRVLQRAGSAILAADDRRPAAGRPYAATRAPSVAAPNPAPVVRNPRLPEALLPADTSPRERLPLLSSSPEMTPVAFAALCARTLRRSGWDAGLTMPQARAQADIVAEHDGCRIALQCVFEAQAISYRTVQKAAAARGDEHATLAAVVSNTGYTAAAQHLAETCGILLLHYTDLADLDRVVARHSQRFTPARV